MNPKKQITIISVCLMLLVCLLLVLGCAKPTEKGPIVIGMPIELSGYMVVVGQPAMQGVTVALEMANYKVAGRPIKFVVEDTATDVNQTLDKVRKLVETDKACLLIGPVNSGCAAGMAGYLEKVKVPDLALESHPDDLSLKYNWMWLVNGTLKQANIPLGIYAYDDLGYRTVTTLGIDFVAGHEFIQGFVDSFTGRGGKIAQQQWFPPDAQDFTPYIVVLKKVDALVGCFLGMPAFPAHRQLKELGVKMPLLETPGEMFAPEVQKEQGGVAAGMRGVAFYSWNLDTPANKDFVEAYKKRWGKLPSHTAADGYTDIQIALEALKKTGGDTSPEKLAKALNEVSIEGIQGHRSFGPRRIGITTNYICEYAKLDDGSYGTKLLKTYVVKPEIVGDKITYSLVK